MERVPRRHFQAHQPKMEEEAEQYSNLTAFPALKVQEETSVGVVSATTSCESAFEVAKCPAKNSPDLRDSNGYKYAWLARSQRCCARRSKSRRRSRARTERSGGEEEQRPSAAWSGRPALASLAPKLTSGRSQTDTKHPKHPTILCHAFSCKLCLLLFPPSPNPPSPTPHPPPASPATSTHRVGHPSASTTRLTAFYIRPRLFTTSGPPPPIPYEFATATRQRACCLPHAEPPHHVHNRRRRKTT